MVMDKLDIKYEISCFTFVYVFLIGVFGFDFTIMLRFLSFWQDYLIILSFFTVLALACNHIIKSKQKFMIVFRKIKNPYPSCCAFSKYALEDHRIQLKVIKQKYGELPSCPEKEDKLWYEIYQKRKYNPMILNSQWKFLLMRDVTCLTLIFIFGTLFLIMLSFSVEFINVIYPNIYYILIILFGSFFLFDIAAINTGVSFVKDVLAQASIDDID